MKKVGILTFHSADSYGAVLQAFALQAFLISRGYCVEVINYTPHYLLKPYKLFSQLNITKSGQAIFRNILFPLNIPLRYIRSRLFSKFRLQSLKLSSHRYYKPFSENNDYDIYIIGSDQIWNPSITKGLDDMFWGNFKIKDGAKKITYAASSSFYNYNDKDKKDIEFYLNAFDGISVREYKLQKYIYEKFNINSHVVCDPTFLVERESWDEIATNPNVEKYVVVFFSNKKTLDIANNVASRKGLQVISIHTELANLPLGKNEKIDSPYDFVGLFKYADFVVCSSFHALAFSLIFNKNFCMVGAGGSVDSRALSILERFKLSDRYVLDSNNIDDIIDRSIDYSNINTQISLFREESRNYLHNLIN